jgi:hypothetical protein
VEVPLGVTTEDFWAVGAGSIRLRSRQRQIAERSVHKRLLKLSVDVGRQDEQRGEVETDATGDRTRADRGRQTTSGVRAEGPNSHFCFLVRKPGARGDETIRLFLGYVNVHLLNSKNNC